MRSTLVAALTIATGLALVASSGASASRAHAQEADASIFYGVIPPGDGGAIPLKVRATVSDITCGTADVTDLEDGLGFYIITVAHWSTRAGCGTEGAPVTFLLLAGEVDPGEPAAQTQACTAGLQRLDLSPVPDALSGRSSGSCRRDPAAARCAGRAARRLPSRTRSPRSLATWRPSPIWTSPHSVYRHYIPGAPSDVSDYLLVDRDDIVTVRVC